MLHGRQPQQTYQPGSIVRVTLTNFVTYSKAEFHPGPNLNMVIGPNGTGKSTLVCAICLGLGWETKHLGRAKDIGEFVKHGAKRAFIEIELAKDPAHQENNPFITTMITKEGNKTDFTIDHKKSNKKSVQALARSFSIQVDNLCQFLPQDRVVEFAGLSPEALLVHTQRAAAPEYMSEWHEELKDMRKEQRRRQDEQQKLLESLKQDEGRQRGQEADVLRMRERTELQERHAILEKLRPFPQYTVALQQFKEAKARKKEAGKELGRLNARLQPNLRAVNDKEAYTERVKKVVGVRERHLQRGDDIVADNKKKIAKATEQIEECIAEIQTEKNSNKTAIQAANRLRQEIKTVEKAMANPPEEFDPAEINERLRGFKREIRESEDRSRDIKQEMGGLVAQSRQRKLIIQQCAREKEDLQSQAGQQANKLRGASRDAAIAWDWIQNNRDQFKGEIFGPPIISCSLKDPRHASAVESIINQNEQFAFTVTERGDFEKLNQQLTKVMKLNQINIRGSYHTLASFPPPVHTGELQQFGLQSWIIDLIEGPEPVLAMLCDNSKIHSTAFTNRDMTDAQFEALKRTPLSSWVTASNTFQIIRRREYGDQASSTRVNPLKSARHFTDAPVDRQQEDELNAREREANGEIELLQEQMQKLKDEMDAMKPKHAKLQEQHDTLLASKNEKQRQLSEFNGLPAKLQRSQEKLANEEEKINGSLERRRDIVSRGDNLTVSKGQLVLDYANSIEALRNFHISLYEAEILQAEAKSDLDQLQAQHAEEQRMLEELRREVDHLTQTEAELLEEGKRLQAVCQHAGKDIVEGTPEHEVYSEVVDIGKWTSDRLETEIESVSTRIDLTSGNGNQDTIREFEARASRIETKRARLSEIEEHLHDLFNKIEALRNKWEPELDALVVQISEAFAENFARIQSAGEVGVHKDDDFEQWAIQIKVKFRYGLIYSTW